MYPSSRASLATSRIRTFIPKGISLSIEVLQIKWINGYLPSSATIITQPISTPTRLGVTLSARGIVVPIVQPASAWASDMIRIFEPEYATKESRHYVIFLRNRKQFINFEESNSFNGSLEMTKENTTRGKIIIYKTSDGKTTLNVELANDTVWLSQAQMSSLFEKDQSVIARHIKNALTEGEIDESNMQILHNTLSKFRPTTVYNLDVIISVGYRVHSQRGVQFRKWASELIKDYLVKGYVVRNDLSAQRYEELKSLVSTLERTVLFLEPGHSDQIKSIFSIVRDYTYALDTLDAYDYQNLTISETTVPEKFRVSYENAMEVITSLREKFGQSDLFGVEKDQSFHSSIGQIYQTWDGKELYPSIEEKAAMLLYLIVKNHSFVDGNKRIAATLFLWFMQRNGILYRPDGAKRIADGTLVALTLMIAESHTDEMDIMVKIVVNLINRKI